LLSESIQRQFNGFVDSTDAAGLRRGKIQIAQQEEMIIFFPRCLLFVVTVISFPFFLGGQMETCGSSEDESIGVYLNTFEVVIFKNRHGFKG
jgi:hypothetical protein